ncbi:MAG: GAF domain-containing protein, partial [Chloroflexia bacterium]|nr:GAF domain-containing protein [Chloroflexia bacterium]
MPDQQTRLRSTLDVIQRANQIAASTELDALLDQMLALLIEMTGAEAGTLYLYEEASHELIFTVVKGNEASRSLIGMRIDADRGVAGLTLRQGQPLFISNVVDDPHWDRVVGELAGMELRTMYCVPLMLRGVIVGVVQLFNLTKDTCDEPDEIALIDLICNRLVTEVEKARLLTEARQRERRQHALIEIISRLTTTLNRDDLLNRIMEYACELLDIEAASIWLYDESQHELVLYLATGYRRSEVEAKRIPAGQGIIGHVVGTGETVVVNDVRHDQRFYRQFDTESGFVTRSILCVPLRAPKIDVGGQLGILEGRIIGGAQALNPRQGRTFNTEDISLFESLAGQAATIIRLAQLYTDIDTLSTRIIDAITGAIDL